MEILGNMCLLKMIHAKINRYFKERPYAWKVLLYPIFTRSTKSCVCLAASILRSVLTAQWPCVCKRQKIGLWQSHCDACNASAGKTVIIFPKRKFQRKAERFQIWIESLSWCRRKPASASIQVDQVQASRWTKCKHPGGPIFHFFQQLNKSLLQFKQQKCGAQSLCRSQLNIQTVNTLGHIA